MIGGMIIEKERKDFSKVQIYIQDLDLCDKLNDDFYNVGCANKSEYARYVFESYLKQKEELNNIKLKLIDKLDSIGLDIEEVIDILDNDDVIKELNKLQSIHEESKNLLEKIYKAIRLAYENDHAIIHNQKEQLKLLGANYNLSKAIQNKKLLSSNVITDDELIEDTKILNKLNLKDFRGYIDKDDIKWKK